jgi:hypothetical protein
MTKYQRSEAKKPRAERSRVSGEGFCEKKPIASAELRTKK